MATTIQNNHPFNIANVILALSIGILVIVVAVPVLLIFLNSFWVDGQFNITDVVNILTQFTFHRIWCNCDEYDYWYIFCLVSDSNRSTL